MANSKIRKVILSKNLMDIPKRAFSCTDNILEIEIPHNVKIIKSDAFQHNMMKEIKLSREEYNQIRKNGAFNNNSTLSKVFVYDWETRYDNSRYLPKRKVKKIGRTK